MFDDFPVAVAGVENSESSTQAGMQQGETRNQELYHFARGLDAISFSACLFFVVFLALKKGNG